MLALLKKSFIYFQTKKYFGREERRVRKIAAACLQFEEIDRALKRKYRFKNPYQICRSFLEQINASEIHAYGETPISTMLQIVSQCNISLQDTVIEMGAGRGRAALFLATFVKCQVIAYEQIPDFVNSANQIAEAHHCTGFKMHCRDMFQIDFSEASVIYLYGTMLSDEEIVQLTKIFPRNVKIITVSYPLSDYSKEYHVVKEFSGSFPWGETTIFWNEKKSDNYERII